MNRILAVLGASAFALGVLIDYAEARTRTYEAGGRRYSYDTRDPLQVAAARKLIEVANAVQTAKTKADVERAANSLVSIFGSQAQREAAQAQARLEQVMAEHEQATAARAHQRPQRGSAAGAKTSANEQARARMAAPQATASKDRRANPKAADEARAATSLSDTHSQRAQVSPPAVKTVFVDAASGIKTTFMTDGSIHEEPIESAGPSAEQEQIGAGASTGSVNRLR